MEHRLATKYILMQVTAHSALELYKIFEIHQLCIYCGKEAKNKKDKKVF